MNQFRETFSPKSPSRLIPEIYRPSNHIQATSWENLFTPYANNKGADQPVHPCSLISTFVVCYLDGIIALVSKSEISSLYLSSMAEQAGLSLPWLQTLKAAFLVMWLMLSLTTVSVWIWAASWQNQQNDLCTQQRRRSAWASAQSDQSSLCSMFADVQADLSSLGHRSFC